MIGFFLLVWAVLSAVPSVAAEQTGAVPGADVSIPGELRANQPVTAVFDLKGYVVPDGSYASINVRFVQKPDGIEPKVKTGYPETRLLFNAPGYYRVTFILNEVSKPSCGGVNAKLLLEKTIELQITE